MSLHFTRAAWLIPNYAHRFAFFSKYSWEGCPCWSNCGRHRPVATNEQRVPRHIFMGRRSASYCARPASTFRVCALREHGRQTSYPNRARSGSKGPIRATFQLFTFCEHKGLTRPPSPSFVTRNSLPPSPCSAISDMASCQLSEKVDGQPLGIRWQHSHLSGALSWEPHCPVLETRTERLPDRP